MTERSTHHDTFTLERTYPASPARVFAAWSTAETKSRWFQGGGSWTTHYYELDFRVGGRERLSVGPASGPAHRYDAIIQDLVPEERLVYTYDMHIGEMRISISLATVVVRAAGEGTTLTYTEQSVYLDDYEDAGSRERGTIELLDKLGRALES